jgi:hypothetical protein
MNTGCFFLHVKKKYLIQCTARPQKSSTFSIEAFALPYLTQKTALYLNEPDRQFISYSIRPSENCELYTPQAVLTHCCTTLDSKNTLLSIASLLLLPMMRERERERGMAIEHNNLLSRFLFYRCLC